MTDEEMINRPALWPRYPLLPVKRANPEGGFPICGVMIPGVFTVYPIELFLVPTTDNLKQWLTVNVGTKYHYHSAAEVVEFGWRVD